MPFKARRPAGGFRVMYEYANRLSERGYTVHITYPIITKYMKYRLPYFVRKILYRIEGFHTYEWFPFHKNITRSIIKCVEDKYVENADVVIATWWSTAMDMGNLSPSKGKKINLIQGYEDWEGNVDLLHATYDMKDMTNVVVATYLEKIVKSYTNNPVILIPNSIDSKKYRIDNPINDRKATTICMMYSIQEIKGSEYGLEALKVVKGKFPDMKVEFFGVCPEPEGLPEWITFHRNPDDINSLYNRSAIFIANSLTEGMALTPMEAMFCGCACILTDIRGHSEYGIDNQTSLLYEAKKAIELAEKITELIENNDKRIEIARNGNSFIQKFSWDNAVDRMDSLIKGLLEKQSE